MDPESRSSSSPCKRHGNHCPHSSPAPTASLYDRLGGIYPIAAVVDRFSNALLTNPVVGANSNNPDLAEWHSETYQTRLPGLKFLRALWVGAGTGGPFTYTGKSLKDAHFKFHITPEEFDAVSAELKSALEFYQVPDKERDEVLAAFNAQKPDVTAGSRGGCHKYRNSAVGCPMSSFNRN